MSYAYSLSQKCTGAQQLAPWPSLNLDFASGDYLTSAGFADQASVGSANFNLGVSTGATPVFTRASGATYRYSDGYLRYAPENLLLRSQEFNDALWQKFRTNNTGTPSYIDVAIAPDGTQTADAIIPTNVSGTHAYGQTVSITSGQKYSFSFYAKSNGYSRVFVSQFAGTGSVPAAGSGSYFDLSNGTVYGNPSPWVFSITPISDGWFRCTGVFTGGANLTTDGPAIYVVDSSGNISFTGNNSSSIYIWGAQLERHSSARPYISTTSAAVYGPRFEYDTSGNPIGLLIEESSTNLLTYSEQFDNAAWTKTALNTSGSPAWVNAYTAPNGLQVSDKIIPNTTNTFHDIRSAASFSMQAGINTVSVYARAGGYNFFEILVASTNALSKYATVVINLSDGSDAGTGVYQTWSLYNLSTKSVGDGWYRINFAFNVDALTTTGLIIFSSLPTSSRGVQFAGDGSSGVYLFGAQLEAKPFATSYIPTVASSVARSADVCDISGASFSGFFPAGNLSVVSAGDRIANVANSGFYDFYSLANSFTALNHGLSVGGNEVITIGVSTNEAISLGAASAVNVSTKIAVSHDQVDLAGSRDGGAVTTVAAGGGFAYTPDRVYIGYRKDDNKYLNGHISLLKVYDRSLQSKLQSLSA